MNGSIKGQGFGNGWAAELFLVFFSGFGLATLLWLGVWFFYAQPAHTAELGTKEAALEAKQTSLEQSATANDHCNALKDKLQTENEEISGKLNAALRRWRRCIRSKQVPKPKGEEGGGAAGERSTATGRSSEAEP